MVLAVFVVDITAEDAEPAERHSVPVSCGIGNLKAARKRVCPHTPSVCRTNTYNEIQQPEQYSCRIDMSARWPTILAMPSELSTRVVVILAQLVVGTGALVLTEEVVAAGQSCPLFVTEYSSAPTMDPFVRKTDLTCQAVDGVYMKQWDQVRLDSRATAYGSCLNQTWNCEFIRRETRDVNHTDTALEVQFDGYGSFVWGGYYTAIRPLNSLGLEVLDSRNSDTNGPPIETLRYIGTTKFSFGSVQNQTNCQIPPQFGPLKTVSVNVLTCLPNFWAKDRGIEHVAGGPVTIYVPPTLAGTNIDLALGHAANAWNTALANYGNPVTFSVNYFGCDGPNCIKVSEAGIPGCGDMVPATLVDGGGAWQTPATLRVNDSWRNWTDPSFLDWLMAHELAHSLGLWEQQDCQLSQSLLAPFGACGQHMNTTGPTVNNSMPAKKTTYNPQGTTAVCR